MKVYFDFDSFFRWFIYKLLVDHSSSEKQKKNTLCPYGIVWNELIPCTFCAFFSLFKRFHTIYLFSTSVDGLMWEKILVFRAINSVVFLTLFLPLPVFRCCVLCVCLCVMGYTNRHRTCNASIFYAVIIKSFIEVAANGEQPWLLAQINIAIITVTQHTHTHTHIVP